MELPAIVVDFILPIGLFFLGAYVVHRLSNFIARRFNPLGELTKKRNPRRYERQMTIRALISSAISVIAFIVAGLFSLALFVDVDTLIWMVGLFSAAFGLGARPFISDYLTGLSFIFEDAFDVGEKIEIPMFPQRVEGIVERVTLRITQVRGMDGELFTLPNGDIRLVRNFSRGKFSPTSVTLTVPVGQLKQTMTKLDDLKEEALTLLPNLLEPWQVISKSGELGEKAELTVLAKGRFGKGAELRTNLLALLDDRLSELDIHSNGQQEQEAEQTP